MKLTMNPKDPAYNPVDNHYGSVLLNGVEQKSCIEADEEKGYVIRHISASSPDFKLGSCDEWPTEKVYGVVEIRTKRHG